MTALWIILGIFAFLFLLLLCPITLTASYETQLEAKLRFFIFSATGWRRKKRKSPKRREKRKNRRKALPPSRSLSLSS